MDTLEAVYEASKQQQLLLRQQQQPDMGNSSSSSCGGGGGDYSGGGGGGGSPWALAEKQGGSDVEELLAHAGYNVRASDLTQIANRIEVLDSLMGAAPEGLVGAAADTVHYNPSDLAAWIELMLDEMQQQPACPPPLAPPPPPPAPPRRQCQQPNTDSMSSAVTNVNGAQAYHGGGGGGGAGAGFQGVYPAPPYALYAEQLDLGGDAKQQQASGGVGGGAAAAAAAVAQPSPSGSSSVIQQAAPPPPPPPPVRQQSQGVVIQSPAAQPQQQPLPAPAQTSSEECGVKLVHSLLACGTAIHGGEMAVAEGLLNELRAMVGGAAGSNSGAMGRVAAYFVEGLRRRIYGDAGGDGSAAVGLPSFLVAGDNSAMDELLHFHFYEVCPYLKFAHFTANQAILEAFDGHKRVHVVDFNLQYGLQWPALIQALALRPEGPPVLRLTGIGPPAGKDLLHDIGQKLAYLARNLNVEFIFHPVVVARLDEVKPWMLILRPDEALAVNSVFQLHRVLLDGEGTPPAIPPAARSPVEELLRWVRELQPQIVTLVEQDADHNRREFVERFVTSLHYYSTMFDSLEACNLAPGSLEQLVAEAYLGREVLDIVAAEGRARLERHETLAQWRDRMSRAGFRPLFLGSNAYKQASMLLTLFSDGYRVEENAGCLTLGWQCRSLVAASAWCCT